MGEVTAYGMIYPDGSADECLRDDPDEVIDCYLDLHDPIDWPRTVTIAGYRPSDILWASFDPLYEIIDQLEINFGDPEGHMEFRPSKELKAANARMVEILKAEYVPWRHVEVKGQRFAHDVASWVAEHRPEWIGENEDIAAFLRGRSIPAILPATENNTGQ